MSHRLGARLLAVSLTAAAVLGAPGAAHAERSVTKDAAQDAVAITDLSEDLEAPDYVPAPEFTSVDIVRSVVDHRGDRLRLSVRYRDLRRAPFHSTMFRIATPKRSFWLSVDRGLGGPKAVAELSGRGLSTIKCRGLRWSFDPAADQVTASVPRSCVDSPRWVRIGVGAISSDTGPLTDPDELRMYADDGRRTGAIGQQLTLGPKVSRG